MDRERLDKDLRATVDVLLVAIPPELANLDLAEWMHKLGPAGPTVFRLVGLPTSGTWELRAAAYAACTAIAALPDDQLDALLGLIEWEVLALHGDPAELVASDFRTRRPPTPAEWDAIAAVLNAVRAAVSN